jgi:hypothetical protein
MWYSTAVGIISVNSMLLVMGSVLWSASAGASDVVVFDRGGGRERATLARTAAASGGDTVLTEAESSELDLAYAGGCVDVTCYSRAGVAGSVATIILVEREALTVIDVGAAVARRRPAPTAAIATVLARLAERGRWGTLDGSRLSAGSAIIVDGVTYDGADLAAGPTTVVVRGPDGALQTLVVTVVADRSTEVSLPSSTSPAPSPTAPSSSTSPAPSPTAPSGASPAPGVSADLLTGVIVSGGGLAVVGLVVGLVGEGMAQQALASLRRREPADLGQAEAIEIAGFVGAGVGVVAVAAGLVLGLGSPGAEDALTAP